MVEIISVRFKSGGKEYYFNPNGVQFQVGDGVIVETTRGTEYAQCIRENNMIDEIELTAPLRPVVRKAEPEDLLVLEKNREREKKALSICQQKITEHGLDMKLVRAEYAFDGGKVVFYFTSEGRVDFRALVKDLAGTLHTRIELRQIGVRDEAKLLGGLGICGKPFCCSQFLEEFQPVSIKMAKTQNLSLNPTKISGTCGRLMCCLKYEQEAYEDLVKHAPKQESFVETPDGAGTVSGINLLRQTVQVRLESDPETPRTYHNCELCIVRSGKGRRPEGYVEPPLEELAKLRRQEEDAPPVLTEEDSLAAAIEAAFPSRERREEPEERRPSRRNRPRRPRMEEEETGFEQVDRRLREESRDHRNNNRRRRHRPKGKGGRPNAPQE
ncbi:MAG: stage 0 sporulation family protein [Lawsonibacter sp.]|nr:stage 0 sporulation family protein [Lawsonibacter sp.]